MKRLEFCDKSFLIYPYTTKQERDLLIYQTYNDKRNIDDFLELLKENIKFDLSKLNYYEKIYVLLMLRSISVGEVVELKQKCKCGFVNEFGIDISECYKQCSKDFKYKDILSNNISDFIDIDELTTDEADNVIDYINENKSRLELNFTKKCIHCGEEYKISIDNLDLILSLMSEISLSNMYEIFTHILVNYHISLEDQLKIYPFERSIFLGLIPKETEKILKAQKQNNYKY